MQNIKSWFNPPYKLAIIGVVLFVIWMSSGTINGKSYSVELTQNSTPQSKNSLVEVEHLQAEEFSPLITVPGEIEVDRYTSIRSQTVSRVVKINIGRGEYANAGDILIELEIEDRKEQLNSAKSLVAQKDADYTAIKNLKNQNFQSESSLALAKYELDHAKLQLKQAELELERIVIRAPYDGVVTEQLVEVGDAVQQGTDLAGFADVKDMIARLDVPQQHILNIKAGQEGTVKLLNGDEFTGTVRFVSPIANVNTRTYLVEVLLDNTQGLLKSGLSAELILPTQSVPAYFVSQALLSLDDNKGLGIKVVDSDNRVHHKPVDILGHQTDGVWLGGLPSDITIITQGHGYVRHGDEVETITAEQKKDESIQVSSALVAQ